MADTIVQRQVERWIVEHALPSVYGQPFHKGKVKLTWGGSFEVDAVSADEKTLVCISTSCCRTASGKQATGKFQKIRADALYLLHTQRCERRVLVFTDPSMVCHFEKERQNGRFPAHEAIELLLVELPDRLQRELATAAASASSEVSPMGAITPANV